MTGDSGLDPEKQREEALAQVAAAVDGAALEQLRVQFLGRKSALSDALSQLGGLPPEERRAAGQKLNDVKTAIQAALKAREQELSATAGLAHLEAIDLTFPGAAPRRGHPHPVSLVWREIEDCFRGLGYDVARGNEVETDYYNFEALNIPAGHPARDGFDTFFVAPEGPQLESEADATGLETGVLLRAHTSPMQIRYMEAHQPPLRAIFPGKVYRRDNDATHVPMFHQVEGMFIDEGVTVADLKGTLEYFARAIFGRERKIRLRPDHFPFTEPSLEVHVSCFQCEGSGCALCRFSGWIEILGAGMMHPNVLRHGGIDPERYTGFAFGCGIDRVALLKYGFPDMRTMFENDVRVVRQF